MTFWRVFWLGILAGAYIGISCVFFLSLGGQMPEEQIKNPGLQKLVLGRSRSPYEKETQINGCLKCPFSLVPFIRY